MASSKVTCSSIQQQTTTTGKVTKNPPFRHPREMGDLVLTMTPSVPPPPSSVQPKANLRVFKHCPFFGTVPQFHLGKPSFIPTLPPVMTKCETFIGFQLLQANLGYQRTNEFSE